MKYLFNYYDSYEIISYKTQIILLINKIKFFLHNYLNQIFIDILINIIKYEVKIDYIKLLSKIYLYNYHFFFINIHIIN